MNAIEHISPSSMKTWSSCNRKWWWNKVMGVPDRGSAAAALGTAIHEELENWLLEGTPTKHPVLTKALNHFPPPKSPDVYIEKWLKKPLSIVQFKGRADVIDCRDDIPVLMDLKTTGNIRYALTAEKLRLDIQMNAYAHNILEAYAPNATAIKYAHIYVTTRGKELVKPVTVTVEKAHVDNFWNNIITPMANDMMLDANEEYLDAVKATPSHCGAYGGCPYKNLCKDITR